MFGSRRHTPRAVTIVAAAGLALLASACGSSGKAARVSSPPAGAPATASTRTSAEHVRLQNEYLRFARCMRLHEIGDFPDPTAGTGGHPGFSLQGGSSSDLSSNNPTFQRGVAACQHILGHEFRFIFTPGGTGKGA